MKLFVRSIPVKNSSGVYPIDPLDLSDYKYAEIYKVDISMDVNNALFYNITSEQTINSVTIPIGYYNIQELIALVNSKRSIISLILSEENKYHCNLSNKISFAKAKQLQEIFGYPTDIDIVWGVSKHCVDITRGLNVLQIYSSIVNSESTCALCTLKIDDPTKDYHECIYTNCQIVTNTINHIDIDIRDIHGDIVSLNANNINVTLFIRAFETESSVEKNSSYANITTNINNLENGKYNHKLNHTISLTNGKIVNANFLLDGKINNLSRDQTVVIDGIPFVVRAGCYNLEQILAVMNSLCGAVFSYINSGEGCFKIQVENCSSIKFETPELANMLGFECNIYESANVVERYQLTSNNNVFKLRINEGSWVLTVEPGIYSEQEFFKKLQEAIYPYDNNIKIVIHDYYVEFINSGGLRIESIQKSESAYKNRLDLYHWFQGFNKRNNEGKRYFTIARYNCFYLKTTGTDNRYHENIYFGRHNHMKNTGLIAKFSDGTSKSYDLRNLSEEKYFYLEYVAKTIYDALLSDHFYFRSNISEGGFKHRRVDFVSKSGVSVYFTGAPSFIDYMNLPTTASTSFEFYCYNKYIGHLKTKGETIGFRCSYDNKWHDLVIDNDYDLSKLCMKIREWNSNTLRNILGVPGHGYLYYYCVFCGSFEKSDLLKNCEWIQYRGSLIDKKILTGFNTEQKPPANMLIYTNYVNTFDINLGYTSYDGLQQCIEKRLEDYNYNFQVNPHYHAYADDSTVRVENNFHIPSLKISGFNSIDYDNSENYYHVRVFSNGYNKYIFNNHVTLTTNIDGFTTTFTIQKGYYNQASLFKTINNFIVNQGLYFIKRSTYYMLVKNNKNISISGSITDYVNFVDTSSDIRVFYDDKAVLELNAITSEYPMNITNGFNLINVFTNIIETSANNDNYLTSFVIENTNGKNVCAAGIKNSFANSNKPINRIIADSNINQIDYYFSREDGQPFNINGQIYATLEIAS